MFIRRDLLIREIKKKFTLSIEIVPEVAHFFKCPSQIRKFRCLDRCLVSAGGNGYKQAFLTTYGAPKLKISIQKSKMPSRHCHYAFIGQTFSMKN